MVKILAFPGKLLELGSIFFPACVTYSEENSHRSLTLRRDGRVAEGARLESVFTRKGNVGSNPTLSATQSGMQRNSAALLRKSREIAAIPQVLPSNRTGETVPLNPAGKLSRPFLCSSRCPKRESADDHAFDTR